MQEPLTAPMLKQGDAACVIFRQPDRNNRYTNDLQHVGHAE